MINLARNSRILAEFRTKSAQETTMGQARKTQTYSDEAVADFGARLKKLQADVNNRLAAMDTGLLAGFTKTAVLGSKKTALPAGFARYRAKSGG
jgi:hypothetical protein